ncbi:hypothetical protein Gotri_007652, partial [Gossypium trilobum]|nr:hypothetical protein [Gossypium trilobum]
MRINGLSKPNYPPDMIGPILTQHVGERARTHSMDEDVAQEYPRIEDEYEAAIHPQFLTPKGPL